ncbi:MAG: hypothetical protein V3W31_03770, partial [Thermodesulfobacteriota bacterium]
LFAKLFSESFIHTSTVMVRRECLDEAGPFNEEYMCAEDYDLWLRIAKRRDLGRCRSPLVKVRKHDSHLSGDKVLLRSTALEVLKKHYDPAEIPPELYRRRMSDMDIYFGRAYMRLGDMKTAVSHFKDSVRKTPARPRSWRYLLKGYAGYLLGGGGGGGK